MREFFESPYITNLLLLFVALLLFRIAQTLREVFEIKHSLEKSLNFSRSHELNGEAMERLLGRLLYEQEQSKEKLYEIKSLQEAIIKKMPGRVD